MTGERSCAVQSQLRRCLVFGRGVLVSPCGDFTVLVADWSISSYVVKVVWRILVPWSGRGVELLCLPAKTLSCPAEAWEKTGLVVVAVQEPRDSFFDNTGGLSNFRASARVPFSHN